MEPTTLVYIRVRLIRSGVGIGISIGIPRIIPWCAKKITDHPIRKLNAVRNQVAAIIRVSVDASEQYQRALADEEAVKEFNRGHFEALENILIPY